MKLNFLALCMCSVIAFSSCTKDVIHNSSTETIAPSSNVVGYSEWIPASMINWSDTTIDGNPAIHATLSAQLSENMINNNTVLVYARKMDTEETSAFPATMYDSNDNYEMLHSENSFDGIQVFHTKNVAGVYERPAAGNLNFRYILIEQPIAANGRPDLTSQPQYSMEELRFMSYEDAMSALGLDK